MSRDHKDLLRQQRQLEMLLRSLTASASAEQEAHRQAAERARELRYREQSAGNGPEVGV
ncbi:hypothetical protein [Amycolatopsis thermoflava]|uniref:hypothetical protein n=1 Tax=Amycolatopsis thermoflava TaxID=84480 RepID=UPI0004022BEC|nr:hypothetical protein [Amycolatopsis thermoflava]